MYVHTTDYYKYGSLRGVYRRTSKIASISLFHSLTSPVTLRFDSGLFYVTSSTSGRLYTSDVT